MRPNGRDGGRPDRSESLGHQVVDVIQRVGHEQAQLEWAVRPLSPQVQHFHRHPPGIDVALQLDPLRPARETEVRTDTRGSERIIGGELELMGRTVRERRIGRARRAPLGGEIGVAERCLEPIGDRRREQRRVHPGDAGLGDVLQLNRRAGACRHGDELGFDQLPRLGPEERGVRTHEVQDAALFWTEARQLIEPQLITVSTGSGAAIQLQNVSEARIAGVDATLLAAPVSDRLKTSLSYTYLSTERRAPGSPNAPLAYRPAHQLKLAADYALGAAGVGADFRFASRPERIELEGYVDPRRVPMKVLDLRAQWAHGPLELRLLVANALNYIYNLVPQTLAPVRTTTITAVWSH